MKSVSMILPVYGVEEYIGDCIKSIIAQKSRDFELVVIDDGSRDKSIDIAVDLLNATDIDYKIVKRNNGGLSAARNTGIYNSSGEYLVFVDSDDVIHPEYVSTLLSDVKNNHVDMAIAAFKEVKNNTKFDFDERTINGKVVNKSEFLKKVLKRKIFNYFGCFIISRRYLMESNLGFDETVFFGVDQALMWRLMVEVPKYTYNEKIIYNYFDRPGSIMTGTKVKKMITGLPSLEKCADVLKGNEYFDSRLIVIRWKISALHTIAKSFTFEQFVEAVELFNPVAKDCLIYPDLRIKIMYFSMILGKRVFYLTMKTF